MSLPRKKTGAQRPRIQVGWYEDVDLPEWGIHGLRAKIDTGARSTAIHVERLEELPRGRVRFELASASGSRRIRVEARVVRRGHVRSSSGHGQHRIFVETTIRCGPIERRIPVNLVDRSEMRFRMILGRTALVGTGALVDPARSCLVTARTRPRREKG